MQGVNSNEMHEAVRRNAKEKMKDVEPKKALQYRACIPMKCPIKGCYDVIFPSHFMVHMLKMHSTNVELTSSEMYDHEPKLLCVDPTSLSHGESMCAASIMYGGEMGKRETLPGITYLCARNAVMENSEYENYLPIMMMIGRNTWYGQLEDKKREREYVSLGARTAGIYVVWLAAPSTTRNLYYTLTVFDRLFQSSRSIIRTVRDLCSTQNPSDFMPYDDNYLLLRDSEVLALMNIARSKSKLIEGPGIPMELIIYENPQNTSSSSSKKKPKTENPYNTRRMPRIKAAGKRRLLEKMAPSKKHHSKAGLKTPAIVN